MPMVSSANANNAIAKQCKFYAFRNNSKFAGYIPAMRQLSRALVKTGATGAWHPLLFVSWVPRVPDFC